MGMDEHMLACVKALAENRIQDAKKEAICCCLNDNTKKIKQNLHILSNYWKMAQQTCSSFHQISRDFLICKMYLISTKNAII